MLASPRGVTEEVDFAEDVDVRDLEVDHHTQGGRRRRQELGAVHHEVGVNLKKSNALGNV